MKRLILFGTGKMCKRRKKEIEDAGGIDIVGYLDNDLLKQGTKIDGVEIYEPAAISELYYDFVLIASAAIEEMSSQLLQLGVPEQKILKGIQYRRYILNHSIRWYGGSFDKNMSEPKLNVLYITTDMSYNGGTLAALYSARALKKRNIAVDIIAPSCDDQLLSEILNGDIRIGVSNKLPYIDSEEWFLDAYDAVIVNVLQMITCAVEVSKRKPTIWWLHEARELYPKVLKEFEQCVDRIQAADIAICAVSEIARKNFALYFGNKSVNLLPFGLPDEPYHINRGFTCQKVVVAIVGSVCELKAQDILISAFELLSEEEKNDITIQIIGAVGSSVYAKALQLRVKKYSNIEFAGVLTREQMRQAYERIDVVVCASREETMSVVITEGMRAGKVCVASNSTGIADYIEDGVNGLIFESENGNELAQKLRWLLRHRECFAAIGANARKTYEQNFTLEKHGEKLEYMLECVCNGRQMKNQELRSKEQIQ